MLTWRTFFCAIISTYILDVFLSGMNPDSQWGELSAPGMFTFGDFDRYVNLCFFAFSISFVIG